MKLFLGELNAKVCKEDSLKPTIGNKSLHEIRTDNGDRQLHFPHLQFSQ
jgi:hypothetical protein